jgi:hypothetical protein
MRIIRLKARYLACLIILYIPFLSAAQKRPILVPFHKGNVWGYSDTTGKLIIQPKFTEAGFFREEGNLYYAQGKVGDKKVLIAADGNYMDDDAPEDNSKFLGFSMFEEDPFDRKDDPALDRNGLHGFTYDRKSNTLTSSPSYGRFYHFYNNNKCALVSLKSTGKTGAIDNDGNILIPFEYEGDVVVFGDKQPFIRLKKNGKYGIISLSNKQMIPFVWDNIQPVNAQQTHFLVNQAWLFNLIDINNKPLYPTEFNNAVYSDGLILAGYHNLFGYLDGDGNIIIPFSYLAAKEFGAAPAIEGFAWVANQEGTRFFIDKKGREYYSK